MMLSREMFRAAVTRSRSSAYVTLGDAAGGRTDEGAILVFEAFQRGDAVVIEVISKRF